MIDGRLTQDQDHGTVSRFFYLITDVSGESNVGETETDPDMLEVGNGGMTREEYRSHFSIWALAKV